MSGGLVQNYSRSPIKKVTDTEDPWPDAQPQTPHKLSTPPIMHNAMDQTFVPAQVAATVASSSPYTPQAFMPQPSLSTNAQQAANYGVPTTSSSPRPNFGAPPPRVGTSPRLPAATASTIATTTAPLSPSMQSPSRPLDASIPFLPPPGPRPMGQQHDAQILPVPQPQSYVDAAPNRVHYLPQQQQQQVASSYVDQAQGGYRQSLVHDGGRTEYTEENKTGMDYANEAWSTASTTASELAATASGKLEELGSSVKGWWNPESKGLR